MREASASYERGMASRRDSQPTHSLLHRKRIGMARTMDP